MNGGDLVDYISMCAPDIERAMGGPATVQELSVCPDCLEVVAYGDSAENMDADRMGEILAAVTERTRTGAQLIPGEELQEHSRAACHLCGSKIHGARHAVTLFKA